MFKKLLFATTASPVCDNAAKVAFDLELKWEAKLILLHVLGVPTRAFSLQFTDVRTGETEEINEDYVDWVKEEMRNTYGALLEESECRDRDRHRRPDREILRRARKEDVDMIVMGAHTREEDVGRHPLPGRGRQHHAKGGQGRPLSGGHRQPALHHLLEAVFQHRVRHRFLQGGPIRPFCGPTSWPVNVGARLHIFHAVDIAADGASRRPPARTQSSSEIGEARKTGSSRTCSPS